VRQVAAVERDEPVRNDKIRQEEKHHTDLRCLGVDSVDETRGNLGVAYEQLLTLPHLAFEGLQKAMRVVPWG